MNLPEGIEVNPKVMLGKPGLKSTRITVELISRELAEGASFDLVLDMHPRLTSEDFQAALAYAAHCGQTSNLNLLASR